MLTSAERFFAKSMGVLAVVFFVSGLVFLLANEPLIQVINWTGELLGTKEAPYEGVVPGSCIDTENTAGAIAGATNSLVPCQIGPVHHLWLCLTFSLMMILTYMSFKLWRDPRGNMALVPVLLLSKLISSASGLGFYFLSKGYFADLIIVFTDFPIFLFILVASWRAKHSKEGF